MEFNHNNPIMLFKMQNIIKLSKSCSVLLNMYGRSVLTEIAPGQLGNFVGGHDYEFFPFNRYQSVWGSGLTYSYKSAFGPIEITAGYSDRYKKPILSANIGFWF